MSKVLYQTDQDTGELLYRHDARPNPLDPDTYLIPGGCVEEEPPAAPTGSVPVYRDGVWSVVEDHRGETVYVDGIATVICTLGELPAGASMTPPEPSADDLWAALRRDRDVLLASALVLLDRHRNQADFGLPTTLTAAEAQEVAVYAQALRDLPENTADPASPSWPDVPQCLTL